MRIVAVLNQKGGVGKTTTAVNLGAALALRENEVLLIDLDPQGNLTDHLGLEPGADAAEDAEERLTAYDVLMGEATLRDVILATGTPHLSVVPSHQDLAAVELELAGVAGRETRLKDALAKLPPQAYDWVLIDCPPSLGLLSLNAMAAAREVFITLQTEYFALRGLGQLDKIVALVREQVNPDLVISGIVATLVDPVTNLAREVVDEVKNVYGHRVFATRIRKNVRLAEAPGHQSHIFAYAPTSTGAADYHALADEVEAWDPTTGPEKASKKRRVPVAIPVEEPARKPAAPPPKAAVAKPSPVPAPATKAEVKPSAKPEAKPDVKPTAKPEAKVEAKPEAKRPTPPAPPPPPQPTGPVRTSSGTFAPRSTPAPATIKALPAPASKPAPAALPAGKPTAPSNSPAPPKPTTSAAPAPAKAAAPAPVAEAPRPPTPSAVPSPALRHPRPWMKPAGK